MLSERQSQILNTIVDEYINTAMPVSSGAIFEKGFFAVSCPTIRNEMADLTAQGYLAQPHTSAGRVPTERGYRFFVDMLVETKIAKKKTGAPVGKTWDRAREISCATKDLVIFIDEADGEVKYLGLKKVLENPEFSTHNAVISLLEELEHLESSQDTIEKYLRGDLEILIGSENPFFENPEYSMISSKLNSNFIALMGPMRMDYERNLSLLIF